MSVINKMLRDLDSHQTEATTPIKAQQSRTGIARDTLIVGDPERVDRRRRKPLVAVLLAATIVLVGATAGVWWYLTQNVLPQRKQEQQRVAAPTPVPVLVSVPPPVAVPVPVPVVATADTSLKIEYTLRPMPVPSAAAKPHPPATPKPLPKPLANERTGTASAVKPTAVASAPSTALAPSAPRQSAAQEVLAQAQSLWNAGSHAGAIDLLRQALDTAERVNGAPAPGGNTATLAVLARELARMELAEGRVKQALELLKRLEPALSGVADVWALRGNAAQRLGHHAESVAAYQMALKLRPNEPRWMLGAAVSLAAQGQTAAAAELAEKARSGGVLSPEVATYLRQLGVTLRER